MGSLRRRTSSGILSPGPSPTSGGGPLFDHQSDKRGLRGRVKILALAAVFSVLVALFFLATRSSPATTAAEGPHDQRDWDERHKLKEKSRTKAQKFHKKPPLQGGGESGERLEFREDIREERARELDFKEDITKDDYDYGYGDGDVDAGLHGDGEGEDYGYGYRL